MNTCQNTQTGEKAIFLAWQDHGTELDIKPVLVLQGEQGRFFVDGKELKLWVKV